MLRLRTKEWIIKHPEINPYRHPTEKIFRLITSPVRTKPDFLILGVQKSGTTILYDLLIKHPNIYKASEYKVDHLKGKYRNNIPNCQGDYPSKLFKFYIEKIKKNSFVTGDVRHDYIYNPNVPQAVLKQIPNVKLIVILRNPVDRAYSHFIMNYSVDIEPKEMTFEKAIDIESLEQRNEHENNLKNNNYGSFNYWTFAYITKGIYIEQLTNWLKYFKKEQFFFLTNEQLQNSWVQSRKQLFNFLNLEDHEIDFYKINKRKYEKMNPDTRKRLVKFYKSYNKELYDLLGKSFDWDK